MTFVTSESFASRVSELGAEVVLCRGDCGVTNALDLSIRTISDVESFYEKNRPDLILYESLIVAGRVLANRWDIPAITIRAVLAFDRASVAEASIASRNWRDRLLAFFKEADSYFAREGSYESESVLQKEGLNIYFYPQIYQVPGDAFGKNHFYAGRCAAERPYYGIWQPASTNDRPSILVSMSTGPSKTPEIFKMCIDALLELQYHVLLAIGDDLDPASFDSLPPHFEIVQHVPLIQILPHASLLIFQGGPTSTMEAMYHGVPLVMITPGPDLECYADSAVRLGIGIHLRRDEATVKSIRESVLRILADVAILNRVAQMQHVVRREPGAEDTANRIEEYLQERAN